VSKLLVIETSPRGAQSISRRMTRHFVDHWRRARPDARIATRDLARADLPFVTGQWLSAYFTPPDQLTLEMRNQLRLSDELVEELIGADHVVIATPVYNYNVPASLKAWIDHVVRKGLTLGFDGQGLLKGKKATVMLASGGVYTQGSPIRDRNIAEQYLRMMLNVIGIADVTVVAGGGAKEVDLGLRTMDEFISALAPALEHAAAA
jgi:FMN-dependent NADH-azoreductase